MRYLIAWVFKVLLKITLFRRYYYALYKRLFKPYNLFRGVTSSCRLDGTLKMRADLDEWIQQHIFFTGLYDPGSINYMKSFLKEGDAFIDIGANVGCFALIGSRTVGKTGRVIAFEPVKSVFERFEYNISLNQLENITAVNEAVSNQNEILKLYLAKKENMGMSSIFRHDTESGETQEVKASTLDAYIEKDEVPGIKLIKIDIEGAEILALEGMTSLISRYRPAFLVEVSSRVLESENERDRVFHYFVEKNYERFALSEKGQPFKPATRQLTHYTNFLFLPK